MIANFQGSVYAKILYYLCQEGMKLLKELTGKVWRRNISMIVWIVLVHNQVQRNNRWVWVEWFQK